MKNVFKMIAITMTMVTVFSCEKAVTPEKVEEKGATITFTADFLGTKAGFNEGKLTWEAGDKIAICDGAKVEIVTLATANIKNDGASADFATKELSGDAEKYYAIFPAACAYDVVNYDIPNTFITKDGNIQISAGTINRDKSQTFKSYAIASEAGGHFQFKNVDAIVYFKTERNDIAKVVFASNKSGYVYGNVLIDPSTEEIERIGYNGGVGVSYKLNSDKEAFIPVRAEVTFEGGYTLTAYDSSNNVLGTISTSDDLTFENGKYYNIKNFDSRLVGALPGKFTINSAGDQVYFSPGNLYWDGESFEFEADQTDWSESSWTEGGAHVSHFFWSKNEGNAYSYSFTYEELSDGDVLFTNVPGFVANGKADIWHALSSDELTYILGTTDPESEYPHRNVEKRFAAANVKNVDGLLIFPDDFVWSTYMGIEPDNYNTMPVETINEDDYDVEYRVNYSVNTYNEDNFTVMQNAGVVFLPVAGKYYRYQNHENFENLGFGWYWSSDMVEGYAHSFFFGNEFIPYGKDSNENAFPIRLVTNCK